MQKDGEEDMRLQVASAGVTATPVGEPDRNIAGLLAAIIPFIESLPVNRCGLIKINSLSRYLSSVSLSVKAGNNTNKG